MIFPSDLRRLRNSGRLVFRIARDYTAVPGPRLRSEGSGSGQEFLEDYLCPVFREMMDFRGEWRVVVDLDDTAGYTMGWLEEVFGGLARVFSSELVLRHLRVRLYDEPYLRREIFYFIKQC